MGRSLDDKVADMRREMQQISMRLDSVRAREGVPGHSAQCRLARIENTPNVGDNTFDVIFLDGSYPQAAGMQSASWLPRQYIARTVAYNLTGQKLNQGTVVQAFYWSRHWWIERVVSTETDPHTVQEAVYWKAIPCKYDATGATRDRFLTAGVGNDSMGFVFEEQYNSSLNITHDEEDTNFANPGNFTVNESGFYQFTASLVSRLARDTSGASSPPPNPVNCGFDLKLDASGISSDATLVSAAIVAHNETNGWGATGTIFTWQPQMTHTHTSQSNLYVGTRFKVGAFVYSSAFGTYPSGYGQYIQTLRLQIRRISAPVAFVTS